MQLLQEIYNKESLPLWLLSVWLFCPRALRALRHERI